MAFSSLNLDLSSVEISLLHLLPGTDSDEITCEIKTVPLKSNPSYETLSYVWGDERNPRQITCGGSPKNVTQNLYLAFSRLRLPDTVRTIWIDQLCIDQTDEIEKSRQVSVMRDIYRKSSSGLIWLGEIPSEEEAGFSVDDVASVFQGLIEIDAGAVPDTGPNGSSRSQNRAEAVTAMMGSKWAKWQGIKWWQRVWTIQEAKLPAESTLLWGSQAISFELLKRISNYLIWDSPARRRFDEFIPLGRLSNDFIIPLRNLQIADRAPVLGPLYRWRPREATNPRDKIYALMGIVPEAAFESVPYCDYTLSVRELYMRVTFDMIRHHQGLLPICGRRGEPHMTKDLPSWAVDWTLAENPLERTTDYYGHCWRYNFFKSAGGRYKAPELTPDGAGIALQGIPVDRIAVLGAVNYLPGFQQLGWEAYDRETRSTIKSWTSVVEQWQSTRPVDEPYIGTKDTTPLEAFHRLLLGDLVYHGSEPHHHASQEEVNKVDEYIRGYFDASIASSVRDMARSQAFFITVSGYFGIGPPDARVGDEVWVLFCGNVPHVLRARGGCEFEYVGDAYVQGVMDGEAVDSGVESERVVLK